MKELSVEQKAKAYDEAKLRISAAYNSNRCTIGFMNEIFPELVESYGEKIREELIAHCRNIRRCVTEEGAKKIAKWIGWLEEQGEQKPAWSEEDEKMFRSLHNLIYVVQDCDCNSSEKKELSDWLKSLKDRIGE